MELHHRQADGRGGRELNAPTAPDIYSWDMVAFSRSRLIGFAVWALMPAARAACTSSSKALAVIAMIGIVPAKGWLLARIARVAS